MFCNQCGSPLAPGVTFCSKCGRAVGAPAQAVYAPAPAAPLPGSAVGRVTKHRNILGVLWLLRGLMTLPGGLFLVGFSSFHNWGQWGRPWGGFSNQVPGFLSPLLSSIGFGLLILSVLSIVAAIGLLQTQSWGRMFAIVLGVINLISIPFGTALGIYTLWVLMPDQSDLEYAQLCRARGTA